ncbi:protein kinase family protein [Roseospira visakhapatnamensis]|uniref:Protein kinase domain-containing protein n=1 Tax=Roseospira visakhapatnamensis TaxID=390880 RepID=A0A7W6W8N8_9PROT|nr:protein kinase family protein [Roseospira visakhapatnamensis]MBB4265205.1 hypothetical protein [Roseospira visakhapatnamensis]
MAQNGPGRPEGRTKGDSTPKPGTEDRGEGPITTLKDRYAIFYENPLPTLDTSNAVAFIAEDKRQRGRSMFALVVTGTIPARPQVMKQLRSLRSPGLMSMLEWGVVEWPPESAMRLALIYERPMGGRVMRSLDETFPPLSDQQTAKMMLRPMVTALGELNNYGVTHRAIRPTNLFYADAGNTRMVLGDCASTMPALDQPAVFETIEMSMATPEGRGAGSYGDDYYAMGVTLLFLMIGRNPVAGVSDAELLKRKLNQGSYATLVADQRIPLNMIEVLRGLLADDADQRWDFDTLDLWFNGRRMTPVQARPVNRAQRAFVFMNQEFLTTRHLAHAMATNWDKAAPMVLDGKLEIWLRRGLENNQLADQLTMAIRTATAIADRTKRAVHDAALANVLIALDPQAPIRYRDFRAHVDGFGVALSVLMARGSDTRAVVEVILREVPKMWVGARDHYSPEYAQMDGMFKELREFLQDGRNLGAGIERCLYEMNESQACLSPLLAHDVVLDIRDVLPALDRIGARMDAKTNPVDRHVAAFVAARFPKEIGPQLLALNDSDPKRSTLGMLSLLAVLQWRLGPDSLHGLASWVGGLMGPIINSYQSRERRRRLEREVPRLVRKGSLPELYNLVDNAEERRADFDEFQRARAEWAMAQQQMRALEIGRAGADQSAERSGQKIAATASVGVAVVTVGFVLVSYLF